MIEVRYLVARLEPGRRWLAVAARRIERGELAWPGRSGAEAPAG
jgi:hypothetical protein